MANHETPQSASEPDIRDDPRWENMVEHGGFTPSEAEAALSGVWHRVTPSTVTNPQKNRRRFREGGGDSELDGADEDGVVHYLKPAEVRTPESLVAQQITDTVGRAESNRELAVNDFDMVGRVAERTGYKRGVLEAMRRENPAAFQRLAAKSNRV